MNDEVLDELTAWDIFRVYGWRSEPEGTSVIIRAEQMQVFERHAAKTSEDRILEHVQKYWPIHWGLIGREQMRLVVRLGKNRAGGHGLEAERECCLYVSVMLALGSYFDDDVQFPWAAEILNEEGEGDGLAKVWRLYTRAMQYLEAVNGRDGAALRAAAARFGTFDAANVAEIPMALALVFPEKRVANEAVVKIAMERCERYGMATLGGVCLFAGAIKFLGQGFDLDPQFPWAEQELTRAGVTAEQKTLRFREEGLRQRELWMRGGA